MHVSPCMNTAALVQCRLASRIFSWTWVSAEAHSLRSLMCLVCHSIVNYIITTLQYMCGWRYICNLSYLMLVCHNSGLWDNMVFDLQEAGLSHKGPRRKRFCDTRTCLWSCRQAGGWAAWSTSRVAFAKPKPHHGRVSPTWPVLVYGVQRHRYIYIYIYNICIIYV